jgi:hypothetical protein
LDQQGQTFLIAVDQDLAQSSNQIDTTDACVEDSQDNNILGSAHIPCATSGWSTGDTIALAVNVFVGAVGGPAVTCTVSWEGGPTDTGSAACSDTYSFGLPGTYAITAQACQSKCWSASSLEVHINGVPGGPTGFLGGAAAIGGLAGVAAALSGGASAGAAGAPSTDLSTVPEEEGPSLPGPTAPSGSSPLSGPSGGDGYILTGIGDYDPKNGPPLPIGPDGMPHRISVHFTYDPLGLTIVSEQFFMDAPGGPYVHTPQGWKPVSGQVPNAPPSPGP